MAELNERLSRESSGDQENPMTIQQNNEGSELAMVVPQDRHAFMIDDISINVPTMSDAIASVMAAVAKGESFAIFTLNLSHVVQIKADREFHDAYRHARFVTADGFPIAMLGRIAGVPIERTTGSDMLLPMCEAASRQGISIFLFGASQPTLDQSKRRLLGRFKDLRIAGVHSPAVPFDPRSAVADDAIDMIQRSGAKLCIMALGTPRQEIFAARYLDRLPGVGLLCFGASLDFLAGTQERAPRLLQRIGLEWAWRMFREPRRMIPRYAQCLAALPSLAADALPQILNAHLGTNLRTQRWRQ